MAKAKYISDEERMVMRIGVAHGISLEDIAAYLGRGRVAISRHVADMRRAGTMGELPMPFITDAIVAALKEVKR